MLDRGKNIDNLKQKIKCAGLKFDPRNLHQASVCLIFLGKAMQQSGRNN